MPRLTALGRDRASGSWVARKGIPAPLRSAYAAAFGRSWEETFAQPATLSEREARIAFADWLATVEARIALVSAQVNGEGVDLSHAQSSHRETCPPSAAVRQVSIADMTRS